MSTVHEKMRPHRTNVPKADIPATGNDRPTNSGKHASPIRTEPRFVQPFCTSQPRDGPTDRLADTLHYGIISPNTIKEAVHDTFGRREGVL